MAYSPELTQNSACTLRRIAWAWGMHMTEAIATIIDSAAEELDRNSICSCCRDRSKCEDCRFDVHKSREYELRRVG